MKFVIVLTALLAFATASRLPYQKLDSQNEMIQDTENNYNYEDIQEQVQHYSIANSFDTVVKIVSQYKNDLISKYDSNNMKNEISIPDTVNVGSDSDTFLTSVRVKGLKNFYSQNVTMSLGEDLVYTENSWEKLTVNGVYHYINSYGRYSGVFEIILVEPKYSGNTTLTKNANIYPMMSPASFVTFRKAIINHTKLPEVFQNEKPQFDYFIKNIVCQYVATAMSTYMYNDIFMNIRQTVKPYLTYQSDKIADDVTSIYGQIRNGYQLEMKNIHFDYTKNNLAKISYVQMSNTHDQNTAEFHLRLLNLFGESDWTITAAEGKSYSGKCMFKFNGVKIIPTLYFNDKTVNTEVSIKTPRVEIKSNDSDSTAWINTQEQLTEEFINFFIEKLSVTTSQTIKKMM